MFTSADLCRNTMNEVWGDAKALLATFNIADS